MLLSARVRMWYRLHRWSSLICTLFILVSCVTGLPLIFHDEIEHLMRPGHNETRAVEDTASVSLQELVERTEQRHPGMHPLFVTRDDQEPRVNVTLSLNGSSNLTQRVVETYDSRTGAKLEATVPGQDFMDKLLELHRDLFTGTPGELLMGAMAFLLLVSLITGTIIYRPFMRRLKFGTVRWTSAKKLPWFDLHNLLGIVALCWMLVVAGTGVLNAVSTPLFALWRADAMAKTLAPYRGDPAVTQTVSLDMVAAAAEKALPGRRVTGIAYPHPDYSSPWHFLVYTKGTTPVTSRIFTPALVDAKTGIVTSSQQFPWYIHALEVSRPLHFGDYGGLPLKVLWMVLDIIMIGVLTSGLVLWWKKRGTPSQNLT
jgi:uncharacterized iron-regulated membrane protein